MPAILALIGGGSVTATLEQKSRPGPGRNSAVVATVTPIKGPVETAFRQDTDAYFVVTTTRAIPEPSPETSKRLDGHGFVSTGSALVRTRRRGIVWKASKEGYQAVPGQVPVLARINFFTQYFALGSQDVDGGLVRADGTVVKQEISNYSVQSGYETIPTPWQNPNGTTTWFLMDRPLYEQRTSVSNQLGAPLVPQMPFPLPPKVSEDSRFSILLEHPDRDEAIQTIVRVTRLYKSAGDSFAEGTLAAANDLGPQISGTCTVDLSSGTLHRLDATMKLASGTLEGASYGPWNYRIVASRVPATQYLAFGAKEFERADTATSGTPDFDASNATALLQRASGIDVAGLGRVGQLEKSSFSLLIGQERVAGSWEWAGRFLILTFPSAFSSSFALAGQEGRQVGLLCYVDMKSRTLKPKSFIAWKGGTWQSLDLEPAPVLQRFSTRRAIEALMPGKTLTSPSTYQVGFARLQPSLKFESNGAATLSPGDRYRDYEGKWTTDGENVIVTFPDANMPSFLKTEYRFSVSAKGGTLETAKELGDNAVWKVE